MDEIIWNKKALKQIRKIPVKIQNAIITAVGDLPTTDGWRNVKSLTNHKYMYRLRVGRFRVFFDLEQYEVKIYLIQEVKKRDERTY
jgi:mRNA-degrading endonuclease RelE of RelBE toxin-antitoxin system